LKFLLKRLAKSTLVNQIVVALPDTDLNRELQGWIESMGFLTYFGESDDVLSRFFNAARCFNADLIVRITADCPLIDFRLVDKVIQNYLDKPQCGISTNTRPPTFPDGFDCSVFSFESLKDTFLNAIDSHDREHVTPYIYRLSENSLVLKAILP
jgi:spore coat polysaccharide biosynthesis protein SpsF (cytidylyltransferase family)